MERKYLTPEQYDGMASILANYIAAAKFRGENLDANAITEKVIAVSEVLLDKPLTDKDKVSLADFAKFLLG